MPQAKIDATTDSDRAQALTDAVACLDELDRRIAERCSPTVLQDIAGNLLLILARIEDADGAGDNLAMQAVADCRALAIESLALAGIPEHRIDDAVAAVSLVDGIIAIRSAKVD